MCRAHYTIALRTRIVPNGDMLFYMPNNNICCYRIIWDNAFILFTQLIILDRLSTVIYYYNK
jgi:hypothetical protein